MALKKEVNWLLLFFLLAFGVLLLCSRISRNKLKKNYQLAPVVITAVKGYNKSSSQLFLTFNYKVNGTRYEEKQALSCNRILENDIRYIVYLTHGIWAAYDPADPGHCELLITRKQYQDYKLEIPEQTKPILDSVEAICAGNRQP